MTLDEAIKHAEEVAEENENNAQIWHKQTKNRLVNFCDKAIQEENSCIKCAEEHRQLAEWLKELKQLREQEPKIGRWIDDKCSVCGKGTEDLISSPEWYRNEEPNFCPFCGLKLVDSQESGG